MKAEITIGLCAALAACEPGVTPYDAAFDTGFEALAPTPDGWDGAFADRGWDDVPLATPGGRVCDGDLAVDADEHPFRVVAALSVPSALGWSGRRREVASPGVTAADIDDDCSPEVLVPDGRGLELWDEPLADLTSSTVIDDGFAMGVWVADLDGDDLPELLFPDFEGMRTFDLHQGVLVPTVVKGFDPRPGVVTSMAQVHMDGDTAPEMFVGYMPPDFGGMFDGRGHAPDPWASRDALFRGVPAGGKTRSLLPEPAVGWHTLHVMPYRDTVFSLTDGSVSGTDQQSFQYGLDGGEVWRRRVDEVFGFIHAPMGGFCDVVRRDGVDADDCWISDVGQVNVFRRDGSIWTRAGQRLGATRRGFSWSVVPEDVDLDGDLDVLVSFGHPFVALEDPGREMLAARGVFLFRQEATGAFNQVRLTDGDVLGMTVADLDGDGVKEIIARVSGVATGQDDEIRVLSRKNGTVPRVQLDLSTRCLGWTVAHGDVRRRIAPYGNTGSFGHGPNTVTVPWFEGEDVLVVSPEGTEQLVTVGPDERVSVDCLR